MPLAPVRTATALVLATLVVSGLATTVRAQEDLVIQDTLIVDDTVVAQETEIVSTGPAVRFTVGAGAEYTPDYFGADDYSFGPTGVLRFDYVRLPGGFEFGSQGAVGFIEGFAPRGSLRYIGSRKASDNPELRGLENVDAALELGLGLGYEAQYFRVFGDVRYGLIGHSAWVGDFGADAILRPSDDLIINFGPRADWGGSGFMNSYFRVSGSESTESGLDEYSPDNGFYSVGVEMNARYALSQSWGVEGSATYDRLVGDAADSPIVQQGTENQFGVSVMLTRSLQLGF